MSEAGADGLSRLENSIYLTGLTDLSEKAIWSLSRYRYLPYLNRAMKDKFHTFLAQKLPSSGLLSVDVAERWIWQVDQELRHFDSIEDAAAEILIRKHQGPLCLNGLRPLSDSAAESLSHYRDMLYLDGLTSLSDTAAESLSQSRKYLSLNGLMSLSDTVAEHLSKHQGTLCLKV